MPNLMILLENTFRKLDKLAGVEGQDLRSFRSACDQLPLGGLDPLPESQGKTNHRGVFGILANQRIMQNTGLYLGSAPRAGRNPRAFPRVPGTSLTR